MTNHINVIAPVRRSAFSDLVARAAELRDEFDLFIERRKVRAQTVRELSGLTNRELDDIGIPRRDILKVAREHAAMITHKS